MFNRIRIALAVFALVVGYLFLCFFVEPIIALVAEMVLAFVVVVYTSTRPKQFAERKPWLVWFPKYRFSCCLPEVPNTFAFLLNRLENLGFSLQTQSPDELKFTRGFSGGDFVIELAKVNVTVSLPLVASVPILVEYGWVALFDTGDLWQFTQELRQKLSE